MPRYIVTYDLSAPGRSYDDLIARIKIYPSYKHIMASVWCIRTEATAGDVRKHLRKALDYNDKLLVGRLGGSSWTSSLGDDVTEWLKENA